MEIIQPIKLCGGKSIDYTRLELIHIATSLGLPGENIAFFTDDELCQFIRSSMSETKKTSVPAYTSKSNRDLKSYGASESLNRPAQYSAPAAAYQPKLKPKEKLAPGEVLPFDNVLGFNDVFRIGTVAEGNCFFHSILQSIDLPYTTLKSNKDRTQAAQNLRDYIASKLTPALWITLADGKIAKEGPNGADGLDSYLFDYLERTRQTLNRERLLALQLQKIGFMDYYNELLLFIPKKTVDDFANLAFQRYLDFVRGMASGCNRYVGIEVLEVVSKLIGYNLILVTDQTGDIQKNVDCRFDPNQKTIVILFEGKNHYELIGRLGGNQKIYSQFDSSDPFLKELVRRACPDRVKPIADVNPNRYMIQNNKAGQNAARIAPSVAPRIDPRRKRAELCARKDSTDNGKRCVTNYNTNCMEYCFTECPSWIDSLFQVQNLPVSIQQQQQAKISDKATPIKITDIKLYLIPPGKGEKERHISLFDKHSQEALDLYRTIICSALGAKGTSMAIALELDQVPDYAAMIRSQFQNNNRVPITFFGGPENYKIIAPKLGNPNQVAQIFNLIKS